VQGLDELRIEDIEIDAMPRAGLRRERFPMCDDAACLAADRTKGSIALDVLGGLVGMPTLFRADGKSNNCSALPSRVRTAM
jgi:hypothetical protein